MAPLSPSSAFVTASALAVVLYAVLRRGDPPLIDSPEVVARRVDAYKKGDDDSDPEYDIVIIGGGTAGCVLASRLSEDPNLRVLLLEAGGSSRDLDVSRIPAAFSQNMFTDGDYNLWTEPQVNAEGVKKYWPRGKMLGGCSAINAMMYHTCAPSDYDEWANSGQEGASAWGYQNLLPYILKLEKYVPQSGHPQIDPAMRGKNGPVRVGYYGYFSEAASRWMKSCINIGIPYKPDVNTPSGTLGVTRPLTYIDPSGKRVTTETAYLTPGVLKRPNLKVAINCRVTRILFDTHGGRKRAVGVEFARERGGPRYRVRARREVVLSAGSIHSPHILMLSGVGPKKHLAEHGVPLVQDLSGVGHNLKDHPVFGTIIPVKKPYSLSFIGAKEGWDSVRALMALARWKIFGSGPLGCNIGEAAAFMRTTETTMFLEDGYRVVDVTSGPNAPDLETIILPADFSQHGHAPGPPRSAITMLVVLLRPQSMGTITLKSKEPFDAPLIDPRYLSTQNDVAILVRGLRHVLQVAKTEPFASLVDDNSSGLDLNLDGLTNAELEAQVRMRIETIYHPVSTCRMAKLEEEGVVDSSLKVYGIENLRVVDASIFPTMPSGHTSAPTIIVAEKASDIIKQSLAKA